MRQFICESAECSADAAVHIRLAEHRRSYDLKHFCQTHAGTFVNDFCCRDRLVISAKVRDTLCDAVCFDPELIAYDEQLNQSWIFLHECGGQRWLPVMVGPSEAAALDRELKGERYPRPLTHHAIASLISVFGAELREVVIDQFVEDDKVFHAKLRMTYLNSVK